MSLSLLSKWKKDDVENKSFNDKWEVTINL